MMTLDLGGFFTQIVKKNTEIRGMMILKLRTRVFLTSIFFRTQSRVT